MASDEVLYHTYSVCPRCAIIDRKGVELQPARVVVRGNRVYLIADCKIHAAQETLYCSNVPFMKRMLRWSSHTTQAPPQRDLEDLQKKKIIGSDPHRFHFPLILELPITDSGKFLDDDVIKAQVEKLKNAYPPNRKFVMKVLARGAMDIPQLNHKILFVVGILPHHPILVEVTFERLVLLSDLQDSCFLKSNVYPALKYYLRRGDEGLCKQEIQKLLAQLETFKGIQAVVTIGVERPFADLRGILELLRSRYSLIRIVVVSYERGPKDLVATLNAKIELEKKREEEKKQKEAKEKQEKQEGGDKNSESPSTESSATGQITNLTSQMTIDDEDAPTHIDNIDPYEVLELIQTATRNEISTDDFHPMSMGTLLEPFLRMLGFGLFCIRPSPFCGFGVCLVNTQNLNSYPASRLVDFERLYEEMLSLMPDMEDKIGFFTAQKLKKVLKQCPKQHTIQPVPNLYDYLTEKSKAKETQSVIDNTQILIVHNNMDLAAFDMVRRCDCTVETNSSQGFVSSCTGCL
eukprot:Phypoly_transcript_01504.p2 GENE.Phypoly_transcript_01504~~Phypoly_transcript_01504.p2  ORF type:complete len:519 (+),score=76.70 Phypoly_transcript_01504:1781-3337(+)